MALRDARGWHRAGPFAGMRGPEPPEPPEPPTPRPLKALAQGKAAPDPPCCAHQIPRSLPYGLCCGSWQHLQGFGDIPVADPYPGLAGDHRGLTGGSSDVSLTSARGCPSTLPAPSTTRACELTKGPLEVTAPVLRGRLAPGLLQALTVHVCSCRARTGGGELRPLPPKEPHSLRSSTA